MFPECYPSQTACLALAFLELINFSNRLGKFPICFFFFFSWLRKENWAFMVILHLRVGRQSKIDNWGRSRRRQHNDRVGGSTPLRMPTNRLLQAAGLELRCVARSVRALTTQPNPVGKFPICLASNFVNIHRYIYK